MAKFLKALIASAAMTATTLVPISQASAHDRNFGHYHQVGGGWQNGWGDPYYGAPPKRMKRHHRKHHKNQPIGRVNRNNDDAVVLGILGLAAGALITGAIMSEQNNRRNQARQRHYVEPQGRHYVEPQQRRYIDPEPPIYDDYGRSNGTFNDPNYFPPAPREDYADAGTIEPWTNEWYRYCAQRYRSFKPATGTYRGYDGLDHFCVAR